LEEAQENKKIALAGNAAKKSNFENVFIFDS
jgi:hypothetical protein